MKIRTVVVGFCLVAAAALVAPTSASAQPAAETGSASSGLVPVFDAGSGRSEMLTPAAAAPVITNYWTPDRLAAAKPMPMPAPRFSSHAPAQPSGPQRDVATPVTAAIGGVHPAVNFTNAEGRVFFHNPADGFDYACSAGTINTGRRRLVLTAGHCVHGGSGGQWMQNWVFYPGYQFGGGAPGAFPAYQLWAKNGWINNSDTHYDYAFAITQNNAAGQRVVDRVGGNGLTINPGRPFVTFIGYPDNVSGGEQQAFCQGQLSRRSIFNSDQQLNCNIGEGSSGGPWLRDYDTSFPGLGWAVSNTSYGINPDPQGPVFGPYYDDDTNSLLQAAENASP
jgi:hypothetical protein